jgi:hypothetical protein
VAFVNWRAVGGTGVIIVQIVVLVLLQVGARASERRSFSEAGMKGWVCCILGFLRQFGMGGTSVRGLRRPIEEFSKIKARLALGPELAPMLLDLGAVTLKHVVGRLSLIDHWIGWDFILPWWVVARSDRSQPRKDS